MTFNGAARNSGQQRRFITQEGAIKQTAGKVIAFNSGGDHIELIDNDRIQQVENRSVTKTRQGKIHHQAGRDIRLDAGESIHIAAGQDVEITASTPRAQATTACASPRSARPCARP